jgi:hypothetical protein
MATIHEPYDSADTNKILEQFGCELCIARPPQNGSPAFRFEKNLIENRHEGYGVVACKACGQFFLEHFKEICRFDGEDDVWMRWAPLTNEEKKGLEQMISGKHEEQSLAPSLDTFFHNRARLVQSPSGNFYWTDFPFDVCDWVRSGF